VPIQSKTQQDKDPGERQDDPSVVFGEAGGASAAQAERARRERGTSYHVQSGETLSEIAQSVKPADVDLDDMMKAIYAANPDAFFGSIHKLRAGADLRIPPVGQVESLATQAPSVQATQSQQAKDNNETSSDSQEQVPIAGAAAEGAVTEALSAEQSAEAEVEEATTKVAEAPVLEDAAKEQGAATSENEQGEDNVRASNSILRIDPSAPITYEVIAAFLRGLANEQGESAKAALEIDFGARVGGAGRVGGKVRVEVGYKVTDSNFNCLYINYEGAATAGLDLFGFIKVQGEAGFGGSFGQQWFRSSYGAASFLYGSLKSANEKCGGLLCFEDSPGDKEVRDPSEQGARYSISDTKAFAGVSASAQLGNTGITASRRVEVLNRTYDPIDAEGVGEHGEEPATMHARERHDITEFGFNVAFGGYQVGASYRGDKEETTGSPVYYANGNFSTHDFSLEAAMRAMQHKDRVVPGKVQDLVVEAFSTLEAATSFKWMSKLNGKLFDAIVNQLSETSSQNRAGRVKLVFQWQDYSEDGQDFENLYFRVNVVPTIESNTKFQAGVGDGSVGVSATKTERIYESIGTETFGYAQRSFIYSNEERPWEEFVENNHDEINAMLENAADPTHDLYIPTVHTAMGDGPEFNYDAGLLALEQHWTANNDELNSIQPDASNLAHSLEKIGDLNFFNKLWKSDDVDEMIAAIDKYAGDPDKLRLLFEHTPHYAAGKSRDQVLSHLREVCEESGYGGKCKEWFSTAGVSLAGSRSGTTRRRRGRGNS
jgi:FimV-like protein